MKIDTAYESKWLRAADIDALADEETNTAVVTIERIQMEEIGQDKQQKPVVYFAGMDTGMVLNKTNANTIKDLYGDETDEWEGKKIGLFTQEVDFQGKQTLAIRVRIKAPKTGKTAKPAVPVPDETDIPF